MIALVAAVVVAADSPAGLDVWTDVRRLEIEVDRTVAVEAPARWRRVDAETIVWVLPTADGRAAIRALDPGEARVRLEGETQAIEIEVRVVRPAPVAEAPAETRARPAGAPREVGAAGAAAAAPRPAPPRVTESPLARYLRPPGAPEFESGPPPAGARPAPPWVREVPRPDDARPDGGRRGAATETVPDTGAARPVGSGLLDRLAPALEEPEGREAPVALSARPRTIADLETALDLLDRGLVEAGVAALDSAAAGASPAVAEAASYKAAEAVLLRALRRFAEAETASLERRPAESLAERRAAATDARAAAAALAAHLGRFSGPYTPAAEYALGRALHLADRTEWAEGRFADDGGAGPSGGALARYLGVLRRHPRSLVADDAALAVAAYYRERAEARLEAGRAEEARPDLERAAGEYERALRLFGGRAVADDALWGLALLQDRGLGDRVAAVETYGRLAAEHPGSPFAEAARARVTHLRVHYIDGRTPPTIR